MVHLLPMLSVPLHQLQLIPGVKPCPLMFTLLEMIMRSSTASGSTRLQALHLLTCLTHPSVYPPAAVAAQSWAATLPLLGAVVTSSKVFKTTNWGFTSLAVASKLMVMLAYQVGGLAEGYKEATAGKGVAEGSALSAAALPYESTRAVAGTSGLAGQGGSSRDGGAQSSGSSETLNRRNSNSSTMQSDSGGKRCRKTAEAMEDSAHSQDCCSSRSSDLDGGHSRGDVRGQKKGDSLKLKTQDSSRRRGRDDGTQRSEPFERLEGQSSSDGHERDSSTSSSKKDQLIYLDHSSSVSLGKCFEDDLIGDQSSSSGHGCGSSACIHASTSSSSKSISSEQVHHQGYHGSVTGSQQCRSLQLQQEGLSWAARHCFCNVLTTSLDTAELLGSLLERRAFWEKAAIASAAAASHASNAPASEHTEGSPGAKGGESGAAVEEVGVCSSSCAAEWGHLPIAAVSLMFGELVSKQLKHGCLMRKATVPLAAQLGVTLREETGPDGCKHMVPWGPQSEKAVQHAVESLGSAVQEYGIVQVLEILELARELPEWSAPPTGGRRAAFHFWSYCLNVAVGGSKQADWASSEAPEDIMQLKGSDGIVMMACLTMPRVLPGVVTLFEGRFLLDRNADERQHAAIADKLKPWQGKKSSYVELLEAALKCKGVMMDMVPVSFCCCNPDCTSLQGVSELGLVFKAEGSSPTSSSRQKGCRPIGGGVCSGCGVSCYCSRKCQRQHWAAGHKEVCGDLASLGY
jgi:hypothetical protein